MDFITQEKRSHHCGELRLANVGQEVTLMGWVDSRRDHGGLVFIDLRDRYGLIQAILDPSKLSEAKGLRNEFVLALRGTVQARPEGMKNNKVPTGEVEVIVQHIQILSEAKPLPIQINDAKVSEALRLKYRYLDLRSHELQSHLFTRHKVMQIVREELSKANFLEIETPILYKSTPEGARDYLVPSRVNHGHFYALPQSPQTLKQLLMIGGLDRYFQIVKCFRDEDLRADRQPEFSQIDVEMSFVDVNDVISISEKLIHRLWKEIKSTEIGPIPRMSFTEAMERFGSDKPDLRIPWELKDISQLVTNSGFKVFDDILTRGDSIRSIAIPQIAHYSRKMWDQLTDIAKSMGAKGLIWVKMDETGNLSSPIRKFFSEEQLLKIFDGSGGEKGGAVLIVADTFEVCCSSLSALRTHLAQELNAIDQSSERFIWVTDFPLLEYSAEEGRWAARHHPFTQPNNESLELMLSGTKELKTLKAKAYDLVCNGNELAGGSIRIYKQDVQSKMFQLLGLSEEECQEKFGFFLEALEYGTPPHGGIAWGLDRLCMIMCGTSAIRDVIAFPKTAKATCLMSKAPGHVAKDQLVELGIRLATPFKKPNQENLK